MAVCTIRWVGEREAGIISEGEGANRGRGPGMMMGRRVQAVGDHHLRLYVGVDRRVRKGGGDVGNVGPCHKQGVDYDDGHHGG